MANLRVDAAGGLPAILYTFKKAFASGGLIRFFSRMASRNACKTCALGMGGQKGGMVNEAGHFPEFCKKSVQAQAADMMGTIGEDFLGKTPIAQLAKMSPRELESLGRITFPMLANSNDTHFKRIKWEEAYELMGKAFSGTTPNRTFFYASGRSSNEAAFLLQLIARAYGTNNVNNCSYYCHQASGVALNQIYGSGTASIVLEDLDKTQLAIVVGANPASNHPRLISKLVELRQRGGKVIVINPIEELGLARFRIPSKPDSLLFGSQVSDIYLQPRVGADIAVFKAVLKALIENNDIKTEFIAKHTNDWEAVKADTERQNWDELLQLSGLSRKEINEVAMLIANSPSGIFMWAMGLTHHAHGVDNILALGNIAMSQGWLGTPGSGLLPIRGHSNVQGVGTVGVVPELKAAFKTELENQFQIVVPESGGLDTYGCMAASHAGNMDAALLLGGNLYASNPDLHWAAQSLQTIPFTVTVSTKLNEGHIHGRGKTALILPALARDEEAQTTTQESMFNYVRLSDGGKPLVEGEMKSEVEILANLAKQILPQNGFNWSVLHSHQALRQKIASVIPPLSPLASIDQTRQEFQMADRTFHQPKFSTPDAKARFHVVMTPKPDDMEYPFQLMTLRSEGQFNSVVYEEEDLYRGNRHRNVVMLSAQDAQKMQLKEGQKVRVITETGDMTVELSITKISSGSLAMYYPEANILVNRVLDPKSLTPAFKSIPARIEPLP